MNPCITDDELKTYSNSIKDKKLEPPYQLLFVGRLESAKGVGRILQIAAQLKQNGVEFELNLIGDGPERILFEKQALELAISNQVYFHGWLPRTSLSKYFMQSHFILLPSTASEGWPKVLSEGMAFGAVVLASNISSIPQVLLQTGAGMVIDPYNVESYTNAILNLVKQSEQWVEYSKNGINSSTLFSYNQYLLKYRTNDEKCLGNFI